jgi:hypothetical protein
MFNTLASKAYTFLGADTEAALIRKVVASRGVEKLSAKLFGALIQTSGSSYYSKARTIDELRQYLNLVNSMAEPQKITRSTKNYH